MAIAGHFIDEKFTQHSMLLHCAIFSTNLAAEILSYFKMARGEESINSSIRYYSTVTSCLRDEEVQVIIGKVKGIVLYFRRSINYQLNSGSTTQKKLIQDVITRWIWTYYMMKS